MWSFNFPLERWPRKRKMAEKSPKPLLTYPSVINLKQTLALVLGAQASSPAGLD
jgi:hypothetical protein